MSDQYSLLDQPEQDCLLPEKRQSEYNFLASLCIYSYNLFSDKIESKYTWEHCFFLSLLEDHEKIHRLILNFWRKASILKKFKTRWEARLSSRAFDYIISESKINDIMLYIIDILMGRFNVTYVLSRYYYIVIPKYLNEEKLFCIVVAEKDPDPKFSILIGLNLENDLKNSAKFTAKEICVGNVLEKFRNFIIEKVFIKCEDGYGPGEYHEALIKSEKNLQVSENISKEVEEEKKNFSEAIRDSNIKVGLKEGPKSETSTENLGEETQKSDIEEKMLNKSPKNLDKTEANPEPKEILENPNIVNYNSDEDSKKYLVATKPAEDSSQNKIIDIDINNEKIITNLKPDEKNLEASSPNDNTSENENSKKIEEDKTEKTKINLLDIKKNKKQLEELNFENSENIQILKKNIEKNHLKYTSSINSKGKSLENWKDLLIDYLHSSQIYSCEVDFFSDLNIIWKISVEDLVLENFKNMEESQFIIYFSKIIRFSQGYLIEDFDEFCKLNEENELDFLITPINFTKENLKPIFSVLCITKNDFTGKFEYRLKLVNFYLQLTIEIEIGKFKNFGKYEKTRDFFGRPGIKSIIITVENQKVYPVFPLIEVLKDEKHKNIVFLYQCTIDPKNISFYLYSESKNLMTEMSKKFIEYNKKLIVFPSTILEVEKKYSICLKINSYYNNSKTYDDKNIRTINSMPYQFLFDVNFDSNEKKYKHDIYYQLTLFLKSPDSESLEYKECLVQAINELPKRDLQKEPVENQKIIVKLIDLKFLKGINEKNTENIYLAFSLLGILVKFPSKDLIELESLEMIFKIIENNPNKFINHFKKKINFEIVLVGLAKFLALARYFDFKTSTTLSKIHDYYVLSKITIKYLEILFDIGVEINTSESNYFLELLKNFSLKKKKIAFKCLLSFKKYPEKKIDFLIDSDTNFVSKELRVYNFECILDEFQPCKRELLSFLKFLTEREVYKKNLFPIKNIVSFIKGNLSIKNKNDKSELLTIKSILLFLQTELCLNEFDIKMFLKQEVQKYGFSECKILFNDLPEFIPELLYVWIQKNNDKTINSRSLNSLEWILTIEKEISYLNTNIQETSFFYILDKLNDSDLKYLITYVHRVNSSTLKNCYKKVFKDKLLSVDREKCNETFKFLQIKNSELKKKDIFIDLFNEALLYLVTTKEDLLQRILIIPNEKNHILDFLKSNKKCETSKMIFEFISKLVKDIESEEVSVEFFGYILKHKTEARKAFLEILKFSFKSENEQYDFLKRFTVIENEIKPKIQILKEIKKLIYRLPQDFPIIREKMNEFEIFIKTFNTLSISNFSIPESLLQIRTLENSPYKSTIFIKLVHEESLNSQIYEECFYNAAKKFESLISDLVLKKSNLKIKEVKDYLDDIDSQTSIDKEFKAIKNAFPKLNKLDKHLRKIFPIFSEYDDLKSIIDNLQCTYKALEIPNEYFEKYYFKADDTLNERFLDSINNLKSTELADIDIKGIKSLKLFLSQIAESSDLVVLAYSLEKDELNFWNESFDEILEDKKITLRLIQFFSEIWSFLNIIKTSSKSFKSYLRKIVELLNSVKYRNIIDVIKECNLNIKYLDEFNKSLNNQEQVKLNKIKMICQNSKINLIKSGTYLVELIINKPNEDFDLAPLSLNDLTELRDRALLSKYVIDQRKEKNQTDRSKDLEYYDQFVSFVDTLLKFVSVMNELTKSLYKNSLNCKIEHYLKDGYYTDLQMDSNRYEKMLNDNWKYHYRGISKKSYNINFLSGEIIHLVDQFIFCQNTENLARILKVLKYMNKKPPSPNAKEIKPPEEIFERLKLIDEFLTSLKCAHEDIQFPFEFNNKNQPPGTIVLAETKEFYKGVLTIYATYQKMLPRADLVQFCHFSTGWEELKRFLNRCMLNPKKELYTLVNPEKLLLENQIKIFSKLNKFIKNQEFYNFAIVASDCKSKLVSSLIHSPIIEIDKIQNLMMLDDNQMKNLMEKISQNIVVVTSEYSGLGKTKFIEDVVKIKRIPICEINISATYDNLSLSKKIENSIKPSPALYKLNLNYLSDPDYFHELIFSAAVFKVVYSEQSIIVIPENSYFYIEIANSYKNKLYNSLKFLKYIKTENIKKFDLEKIKITENLIYVCNYLSLLKNNAIDSTDLSYKDNSKIFLFTDKNLYFELLNQYFLPNCGEYPNFHQLVSFVNVLTNLFQNFEKSMYSTEFVKLYSKDFEEHRIYYFTTLRSSVINNLIETSKEFISRCIDNVKKNQDSMLKSLEDEKQDDINLKDITIKWENSNHFIMIFSEEDYMNIYRNPDMIPQSIKNFIISQNFIEAHLNTYIMNIKWQWDNYQNSENIIENFTIYNSENLIDKLMSFYKKFAFKKEENESFDDVSKKRLEEAKNTGYILTPDNFLKMNLIYLRCMSNLPLIIIGETGCGKTSLLRFFIKNVMRENLFIVYIHSGITISDISQHLEKANEIAKINLDQKVWVFFDEFNTSDCMGEIVSILCEKKFEGIEFQSNLVFVGACNPYRLKLKINFDENVGIKRKSEQKDKVQLIHMVKPLPDKAIEFVWDFGTLKHEEIRQYVNSMLNKAEVKSKKILTSMICRSHKYFQENEDCSSVSLRDINRFISLYKWFVKSIEERKKFVIEKSSSDYAECAEKVKDLKYSQKFIPGLLSYIHCYYLRISSEKLREEFIDITVNELSDSKMKLNKNQIKLLIRFQELDLVNRMNIPEEIALNQALIENIFAIIPCVLNKIPIFICGKPGCSKSLAVNIISSSLRGDRSTDAYFKTLDELQIVSFQGSDSCTSEGIQEVFNKAEKLLSHNKNILPVVLFDEIGLAEISSYNPLKILHKLLEYENCKVGFIAISNWRLDASKMNRALYLARPDPNKDDLILTAKILFNSYNEKNDLQTAIKTIEAIAEGYHNMKNFYATTDFPEFFGLRDFYHTIKYIAKNLKKSANQDITSVIKTALYRNFDGLPNSPKMVSSIEKLHEFFKNLLNDNYSNSDPVSLISCNLEDSNSRYLMIICAEDVSEYVKSEILLKKLDRFRFILGSTFEKDINQEYLRFRNLSNIIGYMEKGVPIILQNMDIIYSSLYDLFNQNFTTLSATRKYCRVALGSQFNPMCLVHENFKAIVFLESQESTLLNADAPFLNRFEKHYIVLNDIIKEESKILSTKIHEWANMIMNNRKNNCLGINSVFPVFSQETINLYIVFSGENNDPKELEKKCKRFLLQNSSMDIVLLCKMGGLDKEEEKFIEEEWKNLHNVSFSKYLLKLVDKERYAIKEKRVRMISVTYDSSVINLSKEELGNSVQIEKCSNFKCEEDFRKDYGKFINDLKKVLYILELEYQKESQHLKFIVNIMDLIEKENSLNEKKIVKNICIIIRQKRSDEKRKPLFLFKNWRYKMFEELDTDGKTVIDELLGKNLSDIVQEGNIFKFESYSGEIVEKSLETLSLNNELHDYDYLNAFKKSINDLIINDAKLINKFKVKIIKAIINNYQDKGGEWRDQVFTSEKVVFSAVSLKDAIKNIIYDKFLLEFTKLIVKCEHQSGLCSLESTKSSKVLYNIWIEIFENLSTTSTQVNLKAESNMLNFVTRLNIPFFYEDFKKLKMEFSRLMNDGVNESEILANFKEFHLKKLNSCKISNLFYSDRQIKSYFIKDFIETILSENSFKAKYTEYIYHYLSGLLNLTSEDSHLLNLFESQSKIVQFNCLISLYKRFSPDSIEWILEKFSSDSPFIQSLKLIFEKIIEDISPLGDMYSELKNFGNYCEDLLELHTCLLELNIDSKPDNFDLVEIWMQLCLINNTEEVIDEISCELLDQPHDYWFNTETGPLIIDIISNNLTNNDEQTFKFKVFFFNKIIQKNCELIPIIVNIINELDIWKYSAELVETIIVRSNLKEVISQFEDNKIAFDEILDTNNEYLIIIIDIIEDIDINSPIFVLLGTKVEMFDFDKREQNIKRICEVYIDYIENCDGNINKMKLLIAANRVKYYFNTFVESISSNQFGSIIAQNEFLNKTLKNNWKSLNYELYYLKLIRRYIVRDTLKIFDYCNSKAYQWKINFRDIKVKTDLLIFPIADDITNSNRYNSLIIKITQLKMNLSELDEEINQPQNEFKVFEFGLAFMNIVYLMNTKVGFDNSDYINWYNQKEEIIEKNFGKIFSLLLKFFIFNFPKNSLCYLHKNIEPKDLNLAMLISYITLIGISYNKVPNRFSSQFFMETGETYKSIAHHSEKMFYIGAETRRMQDYLCYMQENFELLKNKNFSENYSKGGSYICSDTCDYFYIINDCGGAVVKSLCPFCESDIGGYNHKHIERTGHKNLTDAEAILFLENKCKSYRASEPKGFKIFNTNIPTSKTRKLNSEKTFIILNFFTNSVFYLLNVMRIYPTEEFNSVYNIYDEDINSIIEKILKTNYIELENIFKQDFENIDPVNWLLESCNKFREVMIELIGHSDDKEARDNFEELFEQKTMAESYFEMTERYIKCLNTQTKPSLLIKYIEELEIPKNENYNFIELFRLTVKPSWNSMKQLFMLNPPKEKLLILNYYIKNHDELQKLELLWPILSFSREVINECSFEISRSEASKLKIDDFLVKRSYLRQSFLDFMNAWNKLRTDIKLDNNTFLEEVNLETPMGYLLLDTSINSQGNHLASILNILCNIQNKICLLLPKNNKEDKRTYSLTTLSKKDIFYINQKDLESLVKRCSISSFEYGKSKEVFYDFKQFMKYLEDYLGYAKLLNIKNIETVQYQFELLHAKSKNAGIINEIRKNFEQQPLSYYDESEIEKRVLVISLNYNVEINEVWYQAYLWLCKVIFFVRHYKSTEEKNIILFNDVKITFQQNFKVQEVFYNFKINQFIEIYEFVEIKVYTKILILIEEQYKAKLVKTLIFKKSLNIYYNSVSKDIFIECHKVLKRIIIRLLTAKIDPEEKIVDYFKLEQYWNIKYIENSEKSFQFLKDYRLKEAIFIEKLFEEKLKKG